MIGLTIAGCGIGAAVFWLVLQVRPPKPDALVMLARFDAAQEGTRTRRVDTGSTRKSAAGAETRIGRWVAVELERRGIMLTSLRQDLALTGQSFIVSHGWFME